MFKDIFNTFCLRRNVLGMTGSPAAGLGAALSQSQTIPAGSGTAVSSPMPAKPVTYVTSVQACLRESSIWGWGEVQEMWKEKQNA